MAETVVHFQVRMPPSMHERMASAARTDKRSLNALVVAFLTEAVEKHNAEVEQVVDVVPPT